MVELACLQRFLTKKKIKQMLKSLNVCEKLGEEHVLPFNEFRLKYFWLATN